MVLTFKSWCVYFSGLEQGPFKWGIRIGLVAPNELMTQSEFSEVRNALWSLWPHEEILGYGGTRTFKEKR